MKKSQIDTITEWLGTGTINIFGPQFSGKDTQGARLAKIFHAPLMGGGDILRNSEIPPHVSEAMKAGLLPPKQDYIAIVTPYLKQARFSHAPLILSAVGRWKGEDDAIIQATHDSGHPTKAVILLQLDESIVWQRWEASHAKQERGYRDDEAAEALRTRLKEFKEKTSIVLDEYRKKGLLIEVDGSLGIDQVTASILAALEQKALEQNN